MKCRICGRQNKIIFRATVLNKYKVKYYYCKRCNFLQTEEPYWINEAYSKSINISDTGYMKRNAHLLEKVTILLSFFFDKGSKYLDYAGGYGVFVRCMRDIGFNFYWDDKFTDNLFARGFEYNKQKNIKAITTFESFEHFVDPLKEIESILNISKNIIFSTTLLPTPIPQSSEWWYYGLEHGQHVSIYSKKTFEFLASKYGLNYYNLGSLQLLTERDIPLLYTKLILKFSNIGLHRFIWKFINSKTWEDHLLMNNTK